MSTVIILVYFIALAVIVSVGVVVYKKARRFGRVRAALLAVLSSLCLIGIWPMPIHGGFTFLGEIAFDELQRWQQASHRQAEVKKKEAFLQQFEVPTASKLTIQSKSALDNGWWRVLLDSGTAYYDENAQLYWSAPVLFESLSPLSELAKAKKQCQALEPKTVWSLPTEVEQYYFWKNNGAMMLPDGGPSAMAILVDDDFQIEIPVVDLGRQSSSNHKHNATLRTLALRCVARSDQTPLTRHSKKHIPLEEWNRYQLSKLK